MYLWRISKYADLLGRGGEFVSGRWHRKGSRVVYCADHPSTALLEMVVHLNPDNTPGSFQLLKIFCPDEIVENSTQHLFPENEPLDEILKSPLFDLEFTQRYGGNWLEENKTCLLSTPSVVMPAATNYLINLRHTDADRVVIDETYHYPFDQRLARLL